MKSYKAILLTASLAILGLVGCARSKTELGNPGGPLGPNSTPPCFGSQCASPAPSVPSGCPTPTPFTTGSSVQLNIDDPNRFRDYVGTPLNNPGPVTLMVNFQPHVISTNKDGTFTSFGGELHIRYLDYQGNACPVNHDGTFTAGDGIKVSDNGGQSYDTKWNRWAPQIQQDPRVYASAGKFRAFLEDAGSAKPGSLILVIDSVDDNGKANGSVWYYNFRMAPAYHPPTYCWFVYDGPYDCRDFSVNPTSTGKYRRLGTFQGLDRTQAFNEE